MALILCSKGALACMSINKFIIYSLSNEEATFEHERVKPEISKETSDQTSESKRNKGQSSQEVPNQTSESKDSTGQSSKETPDQTSDSKGSSGQSSKEVPDQTSNSKGSSGQSSKQGQSGTNDSDPHQASGQILACKFSPSGRLFAVCDDYKQLTVWSFSTEWETKSTRTVPRRCSAITFNNKEDAVFVADKSGDVYSFSLSNPTEDGVLVLGHVSMLLDVAVSPDDRFLLTSDRDEKIRVSCLPNCYNIKTFCLGHTQFVSRIALLPTITNTVVSGSGDGTIRFWDNTTGHQLHCESLHTNVETELESVRQERKLDENGSSVGESGESSPQSETVTCIACCKNYPLVAASLLNKPSVFIYQVHQTTNSLSCTRICTINCEAPPWSLCFDDDSRLWILRSKESHPLLVYTFSEENGTMKYEKLDPTSNNSHISRLMSKVNSNTQLFEGAYTQDNFYSGLHRKPIDNISSYKEKKQKREEYMKQKRSTEQVKGQELSKKQKT